MTPPPLHRPLTLALVGSLPPWKGISPYCEALTLALAGSEPAVQIQFLDFEQLYPAALYPGPSMIQGDHPPPALPANVTHRRDLHYARADEAFKIGRDLDADLLHVQFWSEFLAPSLSMLIDGFHSAATADHRRPVVLTLHNLAPHEPAENLSFAKRITQSWKTPFGLELIRRADAWVVHYAAAVNELRQKLPGIGAESVRVIAHGLLEPRLPAADAPVIGTAQARERLRATLPALADNTPVFLLFGNLRTYKGVDVALRALAIAPAPACDAHLLIAGAPWKDFNLPAMQQLARDLKIDARVHWRTDFIPDAELADMLAAADALLLPYTRFDAMSGVASLGLRAQLPTIASRVGGLPEMIPPAAADLIVPPNDPAALAQAMARLLTDPDLREQAAHPPPEFLSKFEWPQVAAATRTLYADLLAGTGSPGA